MFDTAQIILWSLTYGIIVIQALRHRKETCLFMPLACGSLNFAWELNALILSKGFWGHWLWAGLDTVIFLFNVKYVRKAAKSRIYIAITMALAAVFWKIFQMEEGMLFSSFVLDLIIAVEYILAAKRISGYGKVPVAVTKLLGDLFAWLAYMDQMIFVKAVGPFIFVINLFYLCYCLEESNQKKNKNRKNTRRRRSI